VSRRRGVPELDALEALIVRARSDEAVRHRVLAEVDDDGVRRPIHALEVGTTDAGAPLLIVVGGVHGIERIGSEVALAFVAALLGRLAWDRTTRDTLERARLWILPVLNPVGMARGTRANGRGVDLMRNAPGDGVGRATPLVGGQRVSARLPWYRGAAGAPMEAESAALCDVVETELLPRRFSIALDCHSGFGLRDRIWFPHAHTRRPIERLPEVHALATIFDRTHAQHRYVIEPQSRQYLAHGDLWDHLYLRAEANVPEHVFLPLTLEMGSWLWVKKNPRQLFRRHGLFNPLIGHRQQRVLRTHMACLDFMARAACGHAAWLPVDGARLLERELAYNRWYRRHPS